MHLRTYSDAEICALEYWERGHVRATKLRRRLVRELTRRKLDTRSRGQAPGVKGARAMLRVRDEEARRNR